MILFFQLTEQSMELHGNSSSFQKNFWAFVFRWEPKKDQCTSPRTHGQCCGKKYFFLRNKLWPHDIKFGFTFSALHKPTLDQLFVLFGTRSTDKNRNHVLNGSRYSGSFGNRKTHEILGPDDGKKGKFLY